MGVHHACLQADAVDSKSRPASHPERMQQPVATPATINAVCARRTLGAASSPRVGGAVGHHVWGQHAVPHQHLLRVAVPEGSSKQAICVRGGH